MLTQAQINTLAIVVLVFAAVAIVGWAIGVYRYFRYSLAQFPLYMLSYFYTRIVWRTHVTGRVELPLGQGGIIVSNHVGPIDPAFVALASDRPVHWMVAAEYVRDPLLGPPLRTLQVIPVNRAGIDTAATRLAVRYASEGDLVGMFPEGRINETKNFMRPGRPGAALVALKARVPVVPCYIHGSPNDGTPWGFLFMAAKTTIVVGQPIDISEYYGRESDKEVLELLTKRFMREIAKLAGVENFEPLLAGRRWKPGMEPEPSGA